MSDAIVEEAYAFLRAHSTADLQFGEHFRPIKYVISPQGRLIAPVMVAMLQCDDIVLFIPETVDEAMVLQVTLEEFDEHGADGALSDRWRIHHGDPPDVNWTFMEIDATRHSGMVIDGDALIRPNALAAEEAALCRQMNREHADDLRVLCGHYTNFNIEKPVMVAADPLGIDVRGRFEVHRIVAAEPMKGADEARRVLFAMSEAARAAAAERGESDG